MSAETAAHAMRCRLNFLIEPLSNASLGQPNPAAPAGTSQGSWSRTNWSLSIHGSNTLPGSKHHAPLTFSWTAALTPAAASHHTASHCITLHHAASHCTSCSLTLHRRPPHPSCAWSAPNRPCPLRQSQPPPPLHQMPQSSRRAAMQCAALRAARCS